jgi:hypothetical protein
MKHVAVLVFLLFLFAVLYIGTRPVKEISLKDLPKYRVPPDSSQEPVTQQITADSIKEPDGDKTSEVEYYIIVESSRNLAQAQQRAEKYKNDFKANMIVLPPSKEGYYRISYGKYSSIEEARSASKSVKTTISRDVWILTAGK